MAARKKVRENIRVIYLLVSATVMLLLVSGIYHLLQSEKITDFATDYGELQVFIGNGRERIKIWESAEDIYYFFLPAYVDDKTELTLANLKKEDKIILDDIVCMSDTNLTEIIEWGRMYEAQLWIEGGQKENRTIIFMKSENLPSVYIKTESESVDAIHADKEQKEKASLVLRDEQGKVKYSDEIEYIKTRGQSSFYEMEKKSYQIKLYTEASILGMEEAKKWLLLADSLDSSLLRNQFVYHFAEQYTDIPSIEGTFVDLYINGEYYGSYYLCEKVEVAKNRLEITDLEKLNSAVNSEIQLSEGGQYISEDGNLRAVQGCNSPEDITGGYLVEAIPNNRYDEAKSAFRTKHGVTFQIVSPENATIEEAEYISNLFNEMEEAIYQEDGINPDTGKHYSEYLDIDSWATKYILEEVFHNPDALFASQFYYKEKGESLIYAGPMWDYDRALGSYGSYDYMIDMPEGIGYYSIYASALMEHKEFSDYAKEQFETLIYPYAKNRAEIDINEWMKNLEASAYMNKIRWPGARNFYNSMEASAEYIVYFLDARVDYFENVWKQKTTYHTVDFLDYDGRVIERYVVKHGEYLEQIPELKSHIAVFNGWKSVETGYSLDIRLPVLEDAVYQSQWIDVSLLFQNGLNIAEVDVESVDIDTLEILVDYIRKQQGDTANE